MNEMQPDERRDPSTEEHVPDAVERIETTRFLGSEFLLWVWFKSELLEGTFKRPDGTAYELWLESQLLLQSASETTERVHIKGIAPSSTPEARLAVGRNKLPVSARVAITLEEKDFTFTFDAEGFSFASIKLPQLLAEADSTGKKADEPLFERMELLELLSEIWREQYAEFLALRTSKLWAAEFHPATLDWLGGKLELSPKGFLGMMQRAQRG